MFGLVIVLAAQAADSFPHAAHARLFASCTTCHAGVMTPGAAVMPQPVQCRTCHDGTREPAVDWNRASIEPSNLRFSHPVHARQVAARGDSALVCTTCHALASATVFMAAGRAEPERCLSCHAHRSSGGHLASAPCSSCHVPLREARALSIAQIRAFPKPESHDDAFAFAHAVEARSTTCQTCHTRESCAACHVNAARVPEIAALGSDARVAAIMALSARRYPEPASHRVPNFTRGHAPLATGAGATCSTCHTRQSCLGCHGADERSATIAALPPRSRESGPGVDLSHLTPPDHGAGFERRHRDVTAASDQSCGSCHTQSFCVSCHAAAAADNYHVANFAQRHSASAYRADTDCSSCHQVTAFCSACHRENDVAAGGATPRGAFHTGVANWLLAHGGIARRSLETCASCHTQNFCAGCHSTGRGLRVNPHGASPPRGDRNRPVCQACHR